jgi:hypothetical protein
MSSSSRTSEASVGIYCPGRVACLSATSRVDLGTRSPRFARGQMLRSLLRDDYSPDLNAFAFNVSFA